MAYQPTTNPTDSTVTSTITAADAVVAAPSGNGVPLTGASTAGSLVAIQSKGGASSWVAAITGTISGTYYFEVSNTSTTGTDGLWINVNGRQTGLVSTTTVADYKTTVTGEFRGSPAGATWFRVRNVGGSGLSTTVTLSLSDGTGPVFLYSAIPKGGNSIGTVAINDGTTNTTTATIKAASTAPLVTDTALVVAESPNSPSVTNQTNGTQQTKMTDGANIANIVKSDGTYTGQNALLTAGAVLNFGTTNAAALNADLVPATDVSGYKWLSIAISGVFVATYSFQVSNDNSIWYNFPLYQVTNGNPGQVLTSTTSNIMWQGPVPGRYVRVRLTSYTSGTATANGQFSALPPTALQNFSTVNGTVAATPPNATGTGSIIAAATTFNLNNNFFGGGYQYFMVSGTYAGVSFNAQLSIDNAVTFLNVPVLDVSAGIWLPPGATITPGTNASKLYALQASPATNCVKIQATAWTSGTAAFRLVSGQTGVVPSTINQEANSAGATLTNVTAAAATTSLLVANTLRRGATFFNESTAILYLKFGATASLTSYTVQIAAGGYYELPRPTYTGAIDGIWSAANGAVRITELQ